MGRKLREQKPEDRQLEGDPHPSSCSLSLPLLPPLPHRALTCYDSYKDRLVVFWCTLMNSVIHSLTWSRTLLLISSSQSRIDPEGTTRQVGGGT